MNSLIATIILLLLVILPAAAQNELLPGRLPINEIIRRELAIGSIPEDSSLYLQSPDYYAQPIVFKRTAGKFKPDAIVRYHFSRLDSLPFRIEYRWAPYEHLRYNQWGDTAVVVVESFSRLAEYEREYLSLRAELVAQYGESMHGNTGMVRVPTDRGNYVWTRGDRWSRDGMTIQMYMHVADSTAPRGWGRIGIDQQWE